MPSNKTRKLKTSNNKTKKNMKVDDYVIAIPSYKRAQILKEKTLNLLQRQKIPKHKIYIFVANKKEHDEYKKILPNYYHKIIIGKVGMKNIRNFISKYFPINKKIFNMDDDIREFIQLSKDKVFDKKYESFVWKTPKLDKFIKEGFRELLKHNMQLFGIYPVDNPFYMRKRITYNLRYIIGSCWGSINSDIQVTMDDKEDYERSLKYYIKNKGVVRFENISVKSGYYTEKGGMQETRTKDRVLASAKLLVKRYPDLCILNLTKKSGYAEVKLKDIKHKYDQDIPPPKRVK